MAVGPEVVIPAPPLTPPPNGLFNSLQVIDHDDTDKRWENGVTFSPESCGLIQVYDPCSFASDIPSVFTDGATTDTSATLTSVTANFNATDRGKTITGTGIPASTTILTVEGSTSVTLSANATATGTGVTITIIGRTAIPNRGASKTFSPFIVRTYDTCTTYGFKQADYEARARRALAARETIAAEQEFWAGDLFGSNPHLAEGDEVVDLGAAQTPRRGLELLIQSIADYRLGRGVIHARPSVVSRWASNDQLRFESGKLYTFTGQLVIPGYGYPGTSPDGVAPANDLEWAYATDTPVVHRSPVRVYSGVNDPATVDRNTNTVTSRAERTVAVVFNECAVTAVEIDMGE